ncbi:cytochrome c oxidase subunit 2 [Clydaea vesicula]|uniref:Cytochrome c oxidase polypeptide II n=1 Tax=Clydaea vesicula TaxID=447962 RepID=A0AAD5XZG5_9FUNG|nr:cytochrome c oxidase subunit 2 [Clydaea vesicula]
MDNKDSRDRQGSLHGPLGPSFATDYTCHYDWSYEYSDYIDYNNSEIAFDSFMVQYDDLNPGDIRNLHVDNYLVLPVGVSTRLLVSSNDVIHSFAIPSLAIKSDAIPGRLNATGFIINRPSDFYGQCSELCGVLHGFMPIGIHATSVPSY